MSTYFEKYRGMTAYLLIRGFKTFYAGIHREKKNLLRFDGIVG